MAQLPIVVTSAGPQPQKPSDVLALLIANILATNPGFTANLPASLVEDIASTSVAAILLTDSAWVDLVNSLTPFGANAFLLNQLGQQFGVPVGQASNTSVFLQFSGTPGFTISKGFTVSDGVFQYVVQDGGIIGSDTGGGIGVSPLLFAVSTQTGSFAVPSGTVQGIITSVPITVTLSVNNPSAGIPSQAAESEEDYRTTVLLAGLAASTGMPTTLKTNLGRVSGVQSRLVSVIQLPNNGGWEIIVGGGDPFQVAQAIFAAGVDIATLVGSTLLISGATKANPCAITTSLNHGFVTGQVIGINGAVGMIQLNGLTPTITVTGPKSFTLNGVDSTGFGTYVSGGVVTPNLRNISASISDFPDSYTIPYVSPPEQDVLVTLTWNTSSLNFVSGAAVQQAAQPALAAYINGIVVGQPINVFQLESTFKTALTGILDPNLITRMVFGVTINGVPTAPIAGTGIIVGDPESFFLTSPTAITIIQA
jgi:hypothetical protein